MTDVANVHSNEFIELLSTHSIANVQNGLIHALAIWLDEHIRGETIETRKRESFSTFTRLVRNVTTQRQYSRKSWSKYQPLPYPYNQIEIIKSLSEHALQNRKGMSFESGLRFLAEVWGGWILTCPNEIIQNSPEFASEVNSAKTESEVIELMLQYVEKVYREMSL